MATQKDLVKHYLEDYPELRNGSSVKLALKVWKDIIEVEGITTLQDFLNKYESGVLPCPAGLSATARNVKKDHPELKPETKVQEANNKLHNTVYVNEYGQTPI
jgi:hypothetical protein